MSVSGYTLYPRRDLWIVGSMAFMLLSFLCADSLDAQGYSFAPPPQKKSPVEHAVETTPATGQQAVEPNIAVSADYAQQWERDGVQISLLRGHCVLTVDQERLQSEQMVLWRTATEQGESLQVYLHDRIRSDRPWLENENQLLLPTLSVSKLSQEFRHQTKANGEHDPLYRMALKQQGQKPLPDNIEQTQYVVDSNQSNSSELRLVQLSPTESSLRRVRFFPRSSNNFHVDSFESNDTSPPEQVTVISGGVQVLIEGVVPDDPRFGSGLIDLSADRIILWSDTNPSNEFQQELVQTNDAKMQIYLEGNIVIRQGNRTIRAERAFYDARADRALIINADLRAFVPQLRTDIRVRAERIRILSRNRLHAQNAWSSTSQYGKPGYRLQSSDILLENRVADPWLGPQSVTIDPETGDAVRDEVYWMTSTNNTFIVEDFPLLYTPIVSGPAENPNIPIKSLTLGQDSVFGTQIEATWDTQQLFGFQIPEAVDWDLRTEYYSERGPRIGTDLNYIGWGLFGYDGVSRGTSTLEYMYDDGADNLGLDRRNVVPESQHRGQALLRHQQELPYGMQLHGEIGFLSDRNYLEQYYESVFDTQKDYETLLYLKQDYDNWAWTGLARTELNDFAATTQWLPKLDAYALSEPLFDSLLTYSSHSSVGYGIINVGDPTNTPTDPYTPLPYLASVEGTVAMTRQQIDAPFNVGPVNFVPFAMGEAAYWEEDLTGSDRSRLVGQAGARAHMMMWNLYPYVQSDIFNLRGLMHKVDFNAEYAYTDSSESFNGLAQYNEFDENAQDRFRRRLVINTFGGPPLPTIPGFANSPYDPRYYMIRSGTGSSVTAPYHELIDDQQVLRFNMRHRLQTKMGPPENMRIEDWMVFEAGASYFPESNQDNFGEDFGLIYGNYEWNVGARTKLLANAMYDPFAGGQRIWNFGVLSQRSLRGSAYVGFRQVEAGPLQSQILTASYSYVMSPKWISTAGTAYDIGENQNRGQTLTLTRVGEYALLHFGAGYDPSKGNASFGISLEPKFGPFDSSSTQLNSILQTR